ncbi:helix-turn-helix domain-containing protein [Thauera aromatica]|uniref:helix-turn-helix domain-containing protein n=1 Tax=Thauera aromatica TaxID=59405 RepID=UPI001FFD9BCC|nr:helix-turn-helix domain-containing protein [Thauera aromatica]MCK2086820.1 helix-turn-helix domain-containing protein [Thauera aromatica]
MKSARPAEAVPSANTSAHSTPQQTDLPGIERASEAPTLPRPNTRPAEALALLQRHGHLDQRQFLDDAGGWRLAAAVHVLRGLGWRIETVRVPVTLANGEAAHIARYRLDRAAGNLRQHQAGGIAPELVAWLALAVVAFLLPLSARWFA